MHTITNVVIIGTGRMAGFLLPALKGAGYEIVQLYGRNDVKTTALAETMGVPWVTDVKKLDASADLYILAVTDTAVGVLAGELSELKGIVVHTSGAVPLDVLNSCNHHGVLYPLQTLGGTPAPVAAEVPFCVEGSDSHVATALSQLANSISKRVVELDSIQRLHLHLAAVLVNNFTNHLYALAEDLLKEQGIPFDLLHPLMVQTSAQACNGGADRLQTGPARRGDEVTIERHLAILKNDPMLSAVYDILTRSIRLRHAE